MKLIIGSAKKATQQPRKTKARMKSTSSAEVLLKPEDLTPGAKHVLDKFTKLANSIGKVVRTVIVDDEDGSVENDIWHFHLVMSDKFLDITEIADELKDSKEDIGVTIRDGKLTLVCSSMFPG